MNNRTNMRRLAPALVVGLSLSLAACDEDPPSDGTDTSADVVEDASEDVGVDTAEEVGEDASEDIAEDTAPDAVEDTTDTAPDVVEDTADTAPDVTDTAPEVIEDVVDEEVVEVDAGVDCSVEDTCEDPYVCIEGVCRIPLADSTWAESDFDIVEPEELVRVFEFLKSFAPGVKFLVLDLGAGPTPVNGTYGTANIVDEETSPIQVAYQPEWTPGDITFRPMASDEAPLDGDGWLSDPFFYELRAVAEVSFPGIDPIRAEFGIDAEEVEISIRFYADEEDNTTAQLVGHVTREEAENRTMAGRDEIPGFAGLFCISASYDPGDEWNLSDILDCNGALMDVDTDGDDEMDAYRVVISAVFESAELVDAPEE